jgi:predicted acyl esterase
VDDAAPGIGYACERLWRIAFPPLTITRPAPGIVFERDVAVAMRDGVKLRLNVFRPQQDGRFPVIMSAQPYGKDALPHKTPLGYLPAAQYRFMRQSAPLSFSAYTSWEAPDPSFWVPRGYVVINIDLRGFGTSDGEGTLFSDEEAADYASVIEWAATQPWSSGKIGLNGVSYLAISQWKVAALRPQGLAAICPWEGFSDAYRDMAYPGGVREDGFTSFWSSMTERAGHTTFSLRREQIAHPDCDDLWAAMTPALERIAAPALICASFSDHGLHTRGSFEAFRRIGSAHRFLYTHRGGKWATYYSAEALALQARFFDCFLKGADNGMRDVAPVRLEVRARGDTIHDVRHERAWPLPSTRWTMLHLAPGELRTRPADQPAVVRFAVPGGCASFAFVAPEDLELAGPMKLTLQVELAGTDDAHLFVAVRKFVDGRHVPFEGSYGYGLDVVAHGWQRIAHRRIDETRSDPYRPFHPCRRAEPLPPGEIATVDIEILPSATFFHRGDVLRLDVQGHWFWRRSTLFGSFPASYAPSPAGTVMLHMGGVHQAHLLVPRTG